VLNIDGTTVREIPADLLRGLADFALSPRGDRLLLAIPSGPKIVDLASGTVTSISAAPDITRASWIGPSGDILLTARVADTTPSGSTLDVYRLSAGATSGATKLTTIQYAIDTPQVSPDGSKFLYFIWGPEERLQGRIHVFTFATGKDEAITPEAAQGPVDPTKWENPVWSPDGSLIAVERYATEGNQLAILPAAGGVPVLVGPAFPTGSGGAAIRFSPDGTSLLATYHVNQKTWLLPVSGGDGKHVPWVAGDVDWQRLAP
jgi:dipeptidyl aminopeptidase/acylaminoacyl peptidase